MSKLALGLVPITLAIFLPTLEAQGGEQRQHKAHEHGRAKVGIVVDDKVATVELETPSESIFGFERKPKNDAEKKTIEDGLAILKEQASKIVVFDPSLQCVPAVDKVAIEEEAGSDKDEHKHDGDHKHGGKTKPAKAHAHSEVKANYRYTCQKAPKGTAITLGLNKLFPRIKTVQVTVLSGDQQSSHNIKSDKDKISL